MPAQDATQPAGPSEEQKAKFREALERKKSQGHRTAEGAENTGSVHGSETLPGAPKVFRRKTGAS